MKLGKYGLTMMLLFLPTVVTVDTAASALVPSAIRQLVLFQLADADGLLEAGNLDAAREAFLKATQSRDKDTRVAGMIGLGKVYRRMPGKRMESLRWLHKANAASKHNKEILFELAQTGFALGESSGIAVADNALAELICIDPTYGDAYQLWRTKINGPSLDNLRKVSAGLPPNLASYPEMRHIWLDLAYDRFELFETEYCLAALDSLYKYAMDYKPQERLLLEARCRLALDDSLAFERLYQEALRAAELDGDFSRLATEAELIFTPEESKAMAELSTAEQMATFFRVFWRNKDPDPVSPHNERLLTHYRRLREAELYYKQMAQDGLVHTSKNYLRLMSKSSQAYEYDPVQVFYGRSPDIKLDQRGLVFVRHGPPDLIEDTVIHDKRDGFDISRSSPDGAHRNTDVSFNITNTEIWHYGGNRMYFKSGLGTGGYLYYPSTDDRWLADIARAMDTQSFNDPLPEKPQDYYGSAFLRQDGMLDLEVYQSVRVKDSHTENPPLARMVLYDRSLRELSRDSSTTVFATSPDGDIWVAVNSVTADPEDYSFALSVDLPEVRSSSRKNIHIPAFDSHTLSLSGVVLGVASEAGQELFSRENVSLLPRPSLEFGLDELIEAYVEVYNLYPPDNGKREYEVSVTVKLLEEDRGQIGKLMKQFRLLGQERRPEMTLKFERTAAGLSGTVAEHFTIDSSELIPGAYQLQLEIMDRNSNRRATAGRNFKLVD